MRFLRVLLFVLYSFSFFMDLCTKQLLVKNFNVLGSKFKLYIIESGEFNKNLINKIHEIRVKSRPKTKAWTKFI